MAKTQDIAITEIDRASVDQVRSFAEAMALLDTAGLDRSQLAYQASPWVPLEDKGELVGKPFLIVEYRFSSSEKFRTADGQGRSFVIVKAVTPDEKMILFTDGSTGIAAQLAAIYDARVSDNHPSPANGVLVENGLRVSEYDYTDDAGNVSEAATYYLG